MDTTRFDDLSRRLAAATTRRAGMKAALVALLGGAGIAAGREADAKNRRKRCTPACGAAQACVDRVCTCPSGGTVCGTDCCPIGQACQGGWCVATPEPGACVGFGQACKNVGVRCCEGLACGSGQGGSDVACYVPAGGVCATTADCTFGSQCLAGQCVADPVPTPMPDCTPSIPVTGDPVIDGAALRAAFAAAATETETVIHLGSGDYLVSDGLLSEDTSVVWDTPGTVTVEACPNADAVVRGGGSRPVVLVMQGTMNFVGPGLSITGFVFPSSTGGTTGVMAEGTATVSLRDVDVTNHLYGVRLLGSATVEIDGGAVSGADQAFRYRSDATPYPLLTCRTNPAGTGQGGCAFASTSCPPTGTCGRTWTQDQSGG